MGRFTGDFKLDFQSAVREESLGKTDKCAPEADIFHDPFDTLEIFEDLHFNVGAFASEISAFGAGVCHDILLESCVSKRME